MNILILSGKFGMGHWSASLSLQERLSVRLPSASVELVEFYAYAMPLASRPMYKAFSLLVTHGGPIYNAFSRLAEEQENVALPRFPHSLVDKLGQLVEERLPDVIIATHPVCAQIVSRYKEERHSALPLVTCVTDLTAHPEWICPGTDCYLVGAPALQSAFEAKGVPADRILVTGIPVAAAFDTARSIPPAARRQRQLLLMGGGLGLLPQRDSFYEAINALPGVYTTVLTGQNHRLYERLAGQYRNIQPVGFTRQVYRYMANADLMLSKPGGITMFEAICTQLPILVWAPTLRQEAENARFLTEWGVGRIAPRDEGLCVDSLRSLLYDDAALAAMSARMGELKEQISYDALCRWLSGLSRTVCA